MLGSKLDPLAKLGGITVLMLCNTVYRKGIFWGRFNFKDLTL